MNWIRWLLRHIPGLHTKCSQGTRHYVTEDYCHCDMNFVEDLKTGERLQLGIADEDEHDLVQAWREYRHSVLEPLIADPNQPIRMTVYATLGNTSHVMLMRWSRGAGLLGIPMDTRVREEPLDN